MPKVTVGTHQMPGLHPLSSLRPSQRVVGTALGLSATMGATGVILCLIGGC